MKNICMCYHVKIFMRKISNEDDLLSQNDTHIEIRGEKSDLLFFEFVRINKQRIREVNK